MTSQFYFRVNIKKKCDGLWKLTKFQNLVAFSHE